MIKTLLLSLALILSSQSSFAVPSTAQFTRTVYSTTPVTTAAWVQLIASTTEAVSAITVFDSCGQTLQLGIGLAGFEVAQILIPPGGGGFPLSISKGQRVSIKAVSGNCTAANTEDDINYFY